VPRFLVDQDLAEGRLRLASTTSLYRDSAYYLVYPQSKHQNPAVIAFRGWVQEQAALFWAVQRLG